MNNQYSYWSEGNVCKFQGGNHEGAVQERGGVSVRTIDSWECHSSHGSDVHIVPLCVCQAMGTGMSGAPVLAFFSAASTEKSGGTDLPKAPWVPLLGRKPAQLCFHYLTLLRNLHKCICLFTSDASSAQFRRGKKWKKMRKVCVSCSPSKTTQNGGKDLSKKRRRVEAPDIDQCVYSVLRKKTTSRQSKSNGKYCKTEEGEQHTEQREDFYKENSLL